MRKSFLLFLFLLACTKVFPSPDEIAKADYGPNPNLVQIPNMVREYLRTSGYFDPNGAEIERCTEPSTTWKRITGEFVFGWRTLCEVNGKNQFGGFIGFRKYEYLIKNGGVLAGPMPGSAHEPLFTPGSHFVFWK